MSRPIDRARTAVAAMAPSGLSLVAVSGGADSLALAVAASQLPGAFGAVVVDHGLQPGSAQAADRAAQQCRELGLDPVLVRRVRTRPDEASARTARYEAFERALESTGAQRILLGHTRDDQAEQVLLGLLRGSGIRSLAGMPAVRGAYARPLLDLAREDTEQICAGAGLEYWDDPSNTDTTYRRNLVRGEARNRPQGAGSPAAGRGVPRAASGRRGSGRQKRWPGANSGPVRSGRGRYGKVQISRARAVGRENQCLPPKPGDCFHRLALSNHR